MVRRVFRIEVTDFLFKPNETLLDVFRNGRLMSFHPDSQVNQRICHRQNQIVEPVGLDQPIQTIERLYHLIGRKHFHNKVVLPNRRDVRGRFLEGHSHVFMREQNYVCQIRACKINSLGMLLVRQCLSNLALRRSGALLTYRQCLSNYGTQPLKTVVSDHHWPIPVAPVERYLVPNHCAV